MYRLWNIWQLQHSAFDIGEEHLNMAQSINLCLYVSLHIRFSDNECAKMCFTAKMGTQYVAAGSSNLLDVWVVQQQPKIVHVFQTKKDKLQTLQLLTARDNKLFMVIDESTAEQNTSSIVCIYT
jgi:Tat protein secretion system quality control protein TatD with DNase activity